MAKPNDAPTNKKSAPTKGKIAKAKLKVAVAQQKVSLPHQKGALAGGKGIHIGYTLGRLLEKMKLSTTDLGTLLGISGQSVRRMLKKKYLHTATLVRIGEVVQHDVVRYLYLPEHLPGNKALQERAAELETENERLQEKVQMLEEMNALLRKG